MLTGLGIERSLIEQERFAMAQSVFSTTANRHVVGYMNDFAFCLRPRARRY